MGPGMGRAAGRGMPPNMPQMGGPPHPGMGAPMHGGPMPGMNCLLINKKKFNIIKTCKILLLKLK